MDSCDFWQKFWLTILDKGLLALIVLIAGYYLNKWLEVFKGRLSREQEFSRIANAAVVDLTRKLATGSHLISWLSWSATQPHVTLTGNDFTTYDKGMIEVMSDLVGLQASVAALYPSKSSVLSDFAEQLYSRDIEVGRARDLFRTRNPKDVQQAVAILSAIYQESIAFDKALLEAVTGMLQSSTVSG